jgi:hypothetical protein
MSGGNGSSGYQVTASDLQTHVQSIQQVAATVGQALSAAQQVTVGVQAYGMICGPLFVPIVLAVSAPGLVTLGLAQQAMNTIAQNVQQTAATYQSAEQRNAASFTSINRGSR